MKLSQSTGQKRMIKLTEFRLPLMTLATVIAMSSAASCFCFTAAPRASVLQKRVVARAHLKGTRELQQVVIWGTPSTVGSRNATAAHLAIEDVSRGQRIWQADEPFHATDISSIQVVDVDGDSIPEVLSLWRDGSQDVLRVFHWNRSSRSFAELGFKRDQNLSSVKSYRVQGRRIIMYRRGEIRGLEFEVRGSEIVPMRGGGGVMAQTESGIEGEALISPTRPGPVRQGESSTAPFKTTLVISRANDGVEVARVETGSDGRFRVTLPPGVYKVSPPPVRGRMLPRASEQTVTVIPGKFAKVTMDFDSGMR